MTNENRRATKDTPLWLVEGYIIPAPTASRARAAGNGQAVYAGYAAVPPQESVRAVPNRRYVPVGARAHQAVLLYAYLSFDFPVNTAQFDIRRITNAALRDFSANTGNAISKLRKEHQEAIWRYLRITSNKKATNFRRNKPFIEAMDSLDLFLQGGDDRACSAMEAFAAILERYEFSAAEVRDRSRKGKRIPIPRI